MLRKWEDVSTTDTFTMYYASVFRGRRVVSNRCQLIPAIMFLLLAAHKS
jgi:hypothetical protein